MGPDAAGGRTERFVAPTKQTAAAEGARRLGRGTAALGRELVGAVRNVGACYTGSVSLAHWPEKGLVDETEVVGLGLGIRGSERISSTTAACSSSLLRKCERLIR